MPRAKPNVLRKIAHDQLDACFDDLTPERSNELAISMVRQWICNDGKAVVITRSHIYCFDKTPLAKNQTQVVRKDIESAFVDNLRASGIAEEEISTLLHELSVRQSVRCYSDSGQELELRVDPKKKVLCILPVYEEGC